MKKTYVYIAVLLAFPVSIFAQTAATSSVKVEDIVYKKYVTPVATPTPVASTITETTVALGDLITVNLTSQRDPATPIDLFALAFAANGFPTKKVFIQTVFNEEKGILKKYRVSINEDLFSELDGATSMRIGYCLGGCLTSPARLIPGKIILPKITSASTTQPYTLPTF